MPACLHHLHPPPPFLGLWVAGEHVPKDGSLQPLRKKVMIVLKIDVHLELGINSLPIYLYVCISFLGRQAQRGVLERMIDMCNGT